MEVILLVLFHLAMTAGVGTFWAHTMDLSAQARYTHRQVADPDQKNYAYVFAALWPFVLAPIIAYHLNTRGNLRRVEEDVRQKAIQAYKDDMESKSKQLEKEFFGDPGQVRSIPKGVTDYATWSKPKTKRGGVYGAEADRVGRKNMEEKRGW